jgi:Neprosin
MKSHKFALRMAAFAAAAVFTTSAPLHAQQFVTFSDFVQSILAADDNTVLALPTTKATSAAAVEEMRQQLLALYNGVQVTQSYVVGSQTIDCIPILQQPAVRMLGLKSIVQPPSAPATAPGQVPQTATLPSQLPAGKTQDAFGNTLGCQGDTIPMVRVTLEQMAQFNTLHDFFSKGPDGAGQAKDPAVVPPATATHKYVFYYQYVNNHGDEADINLWRPDVYTDIGEIFSLAQSWTIGGSGASTQTAEVGWQNYPALYGTESAAPFIYYTADDYNTTGCYNLTCGKFVQVSKAITFGAAFAAGSYSVPHNSTQYYLPFQYKFASGNWYLFYNGTEIGYYPGSVYLGGQLTQYSTLLEFGSESVGTTVWPAEGSGLFGATYAYDEAAWQRLLFYINTSNVSIWDSLTYDAPSPACYTGSPATYSSSSGWGIYFYFGGPGGTGC